MTQGNFTIPTRVYLSAEQRDLLLALVREHEIDVPDLLSELLVSFLDHLPEPSEQADLLSPPAPDDAAAAHAHELRRRRSELRRLRMRLNSQDDDNPPPPWFAGYVAELEHELARMEQEGSGV